MIDTLLVGRNCQQLLAGPRSIGTRGFLRLVSLRVRRTTYARSRTHGGEGKTLDAGSVALRVSRATRHRHFGVRLEPRARARTPSTGSRSLDVVWNDVNVEELRGEGGVGPWTGVSNA